MHAALNKRWTYLKLFFTNKRRKAVMATVLVTLLFLVLPRIEVKAAITKVSVQPLSTTVWGVGESITINITVKDVTDLYGWELKLYYNKGILNGTNVVEGPFLKAKGETFFQCTFTDDYNLTHGQLATFNSLLGNISGASGSGVLATITFETIHLGSCLLNLEDTKLGDVNSTLIPHDTVDGSVQVVKAVRDVAINNLSVSSNEVVEGQIINVYATVANQGNKTETFNVTAYHNETIITTQTVNSLSTQTQTILTFTWNTIGITHNASFIIKAEASPVPDETNLANNLFINGLVKIVEGVHNIAIESVTPSTNEVYEGSVVNVKVKTANKGDYYESFNVTVYYNETVIGTQTTSLPHNSTQYMEFAWDTTSVEINATYIIKAVASYVAEETNLTDNTLVDGHVKVYPRTMLSINITEVNPSNQLGQPVNHFTTGTTAYFQVLVNSNSLTAENVLITIDFHDSSGNAIGVASFKGPLASGTTTFLIGFPVPTTVELGNAVVYVNALTDWPHLGGIAHCPEKSAVFEIREP